VASSIEGARIGSPLNVFMAAPPPDARSAMAQTAPTVSIPTEPVIVSSDRSADLTPYICHIYNLDPQEWGEVLPWNFPQNASKEKEESFLRDFFDEREIHLRGFRFLKMAWYGTAMWNEKTRIPSIAHWWMEQNREIWMDPKMTDFILREDADLSTFFSPEEVKSYGEKLLYWVIKAIQTMFKQSRQQIASQSMQNAASVPQQDAAKQHDQQVNKAAETTIDRSAPPVQSSADLIKKLLDAPKPTASQDSRKMSTTPATASAKPDMEPLRKVQTMDAAPRPVGNFPPAHREPYGREFPPAENGRPPFPYNRKRGGSIGRRQSNARPPRNFTQQTYYEPQYYPSPQQNFASPNFVPAQPPQHPELGRMNPGGAPEYVPSHVPPRAGFYGQGPQPPHPGQMNDGAQQFAPPPYTHHAMQPGRTMVPSEQAIPPRFDNPYYTPQHGPPTGDHANGRDANRLFSGNNNPSWSYDDGSRATRGGKRRESNASRGSRSRGSFSGRGGKGSRGDHLLDREFQFWPDAANQGLAPIPPFNTSSNHFKNHRPSLADQNNWRARQHQENMPPSNRVTSGPPNYQQPPPGLGYQMPQVSQVPQMQQMSQMPPVKPYQAQFREQMANGAQGQHPPRVASDSRPPPEQRQLSERRMTSSWDSRLWEMFLKPDPSPIHDEHSAEAKENPGRILTENFIGKDITYVCKVVVFYTPGTMTEDQVKQICEPFGKIKVLDPISPKPSYPPAVKPPVGQWVTFESPEAARAIVAASEEDENFHRGCKLCAKVPFEFWCPGKPFYPGRIFYRPAAPAKTSMDAAVFDSRLNTLKEDAPSLGHTSPTIKGSFTSVPENVSGETTPTGSMSATPKKKKQQNKSKAKKGPKPVTERTEAAEKAGSKQHDPTFEDTSAPDKSLSAPVQSAAESNDEAPSLQAVDSNTKADSPSDSEVSAKKLSRKASVVPARVQTKDDQRKSFDSSLAPQTRSEPSFSPEVQMKPQFPKVTMPQTEQKSETEHSEVTEEDKTSEPSRDSNAPAQSPKTLVQPESKEEQGDDQQIQGSADSVMSSKVESSPEKSDVDDSFHTATDSVSEIERRANQELDRGSDNLSMASGSDQNTPLPSPIVGKEDVPESPGSSHTLTFEGNGPAVKPEASTPASPLSSASSAVLKAPVPKLPAIQTAEAQKSRSASGNAVPPTPGYVTAPATPAVTSNASSRADESEIAPQMQQQKKPEKIKGPAQTESLSMFGKKKRVKAAGGKNQRGASGTVTSTVQLDKPDLPPQPTKSNKSNRSSVDNLTKPSTTIEQTEEKSKPVTKSDGADIQENSTLQTQTVFDGSQDGDVSKPEAARAGIKKNASPNMENDRAGIVVLNNGENTSARTGHVGESSESTPAAPSDTQSPTNSGTFWPTLLSAGKSKSMGVKADGSLNETAKEAAVDTSSSKQAHAVFVTADSAGSRSDNDSVSQQPFRSGSEFRTGDGCRDSGHSGGHPSDSGDYPTGLGISTDPEAEVADGTKPKKKKKSNKKKKKTKPSVDGGNGENADESTEVVEREDNSVVIGNKGKFIVYFVFDF
jgi:hypothetical protein